MAYGRDAFHPCPISLLTAGLESAQKSHTAAHRLSESGARSPVMVDRAIRVGMDVVERTFHDLADAYAVSIAESH
jgi:hypothetical protein